MLILRVSQLDNKYGSPVVALCNKERNRNVTVILRQRGFGFQQFTKMIAVKILGKYVLMNIHSF